MNRQSHIADVENEELKIQGVELENIGDEWRLTLTNESDARGNWSTLRFTVVNLDTKDSQIVGVGVKPGNQGTMQYAWNSSVEGSMHNLSRRIPVPAAKSTEITLSLVANFTASQPAFPVNTSLHLQYDDSLTIRVITSLQNVFEETFKPPIPGMKTRIESEDLTVARRSILILDGSDSTDDGTIGQWNWTLLDGSRTCPGPGSWDDTGNITGSYSEGKIVRLTLPDSGPFQVILKVTDDNGMTGTSSPVTIPRNPGFNPPVGLFVNRTLFPDIRVTVRDIGGNPVSGSAVSFIKFTDTYGNLTLTNWSALTDGSGDVLTTWLDGKGTIRVISGQLPPVDLAV
jgi:hypothetical protein